MAVDERTFVADVAGWVTAILTRRQDLPYGPAHVEEHGVGSRSRHDFVLYRRGTNRVVLTGEVKMPDSPEGVSPFHQHLVEDAFTKASRAGTSYYFTWNVREFVLFETHREGVPFMDRRVEGPVHVADITTSDDVKRDDIHNAIKEYWEKFLEGLAALEQGQRRLQNMPLDQRFVRRVEAALEEPIAATNAALLQQCRTDRQFNTELRRWMVTEQGWEDSTLDEVLRQNIDRASHLSCYVLMTRLVFYEVLRRRFPSIAPMGGMQLENPEELSQAIGARFNEAVSYSGDYETIFQPRDFGSTLPFIPSNAHRLWKAVIERIEEFDFSRLDFDIIGQLYERLIGPSERRRYGQFYTSPDVVDLINAFCIREPHARVLDPACGGGTFLVRAYARKRALAQRCGETLTHDQLLSEIIGIDSATFPAQLSIINLAIRSITQTANYPRVIRQDFFEAAKGGALFFAGSADESAGKVVLEDIDAVVGNPPYIRQEELPRQYKDHLKTLFRSEWPGQTSPSGRSDIYVHFFSHGAALIKTAGYLGFVTSIGWLDTDYGFRLQELLLKNFRIIAVIESQVEKWFEDARVTTAVTILQREPDERARMSNVVRFIQLRKPLADIYSEALKGPINETNEIARQADLDAIRDLIEEINSHQNTDYWRVHVVPQSLLWDIGSRLPRAVSSEEPDEESDAGEPQPQGKERQAALADDQAETLQREAVQYKGGKWGQYVRAPDIWFDISETAEDRLVPLHELAEIQRGFTSGADKFYCVRDVTDAQLKKYPKTAKFEQVWGIWPKDTKKIRIIRDGDGGLHLVEARFLEPEFHTLMEAKRPVIRVEDVGRLIINAPVRRASLRGTHLGRYVAYAEEWGWNTGPTIASRARVRPWYDLGLRPKEERADMFWPKIQQYRHIVPWNEDGLPCNSSIYNVWARDGVLPKVLWSVLNSSLVALSKHQFGRIRGIEGNLQVDVFSANSMLVPDIRQVESEMAARAVQAAEMMSQGLSRRYLYEEFDLESRQQLDDAVLEIIGVEDAEERSRFRGRIYDAIRDLYTATREREIVAQRHRRQAQRNGGPSAADIAEDIWEEHRDSLNLLSFPEDFVHQWAGSDYFDLPDGQVEVGTAMIETGRQLRAGTIRVGGPTGHILEVGSVKRARFIQTLAECGHYGSVRVPGDEECESAFQEFTRYKKELTQRFDTLASQRTRDQRRQRQIVAILMRRALCWRQ
jgi:type I restriction-modification system DNA methylase subunit